jgi:uncharacterized protein with NRDE domain
MFLGVCTLAIYRKVWERWPLVVAANRDEFLDRETDQPGPWGDVPGLVAGRDIRAGGTWFGVRDRPAPLVVGILNRRQVDGPAPATGPGQRSRGLLCVDALASGGVAQGLHLVAQNPPKLYAGFNLLFADTDRAVVVDNRDEYHETELPEGLSVLTNLDINDPRCPRLSNAVTAFAAVTRDLPAEPSSTELTTALRVALGNHDSEDREQLQNPLARVCVHAEGYGTRSSSIVLVDAQAHPSLFNAPGPPCRTEFSPVAFPD